jgi:formate hydrogenlyase transcriptional activator
MLGAPMCSDSEGWSNVRAEVAVRRYQALLQMMDTLAHQGMLPELLGKLATELKNVVVFDFINFAFYEESRNVMVLNVWEGEQSPPLPIEFELDKSASGWVWQNQKALVWSEPEHGKRFPKLLELLQSRGMQSYGVLPLSTPQRRLGAIGFGTTQPNAYSETDLEFLSRVAELVALVVDNTLTRQALRDEKERLKTLVEVNNSLTSSLNVQELFPVISGHMGRVVAHDFAGVDIYDPGMPGEHAMHLNNVGGKISIPETDARPDAALDARLTSSETRIIRSNDLGHVRSVLAERIREAGIQALYTIPLVTPKGVLGTLNVGRKEEGTFSVGDRELLHQIAKQLAIVLENARAYREIAELKDKLAGEKLYLEDEIRTELNFEEIIGESSALKSVLAQARTVATSDATVLILGETGTGKELIARAIHKMSERRDESFIKLNCAAIPTGLLESELFGHEKGAFTGAISQKVGRMELADRGTLFLDEIGDIPLELQPKLLRVLQDHEFERLGSNRTLKVNVRLLAATNRDLAKSVAAHEFRSDLYYRLNVFPIHVPSLRERRKDIPLLVRYFVQRLAQRMNKPIQTIPSETMSALVNWDWPGNVRELENFIERSVILTTGSVLKAPLAELMSVHEENHSRRDTTLHTAEREHILRVLRETGGVISGTRGAAARLGLKRTTLQSKMQKLGISRQDFEN